MKPNNQISYLKAKREHYRERQDIADKYGETEDVERDEEVIQRCTMEIYKLGVNNVSRNDKA
ncbi:hypothetical protein LCGC14_1844430 [marine sediment metagenome]|uniref:Uncharacterized protein n=1 Tax=marine sediment metagenome TaxID=412755 RepID=A0A0F9IRU4_9ZZZZ